MVLNSQRDDFQTGHYSYRHAMRNEHQTVEEAKFAADYYVRFIWDYAKQLLKEGKEYDAYYQFAIGLHILQDATSPAHSGFQLWTGRESKWQQFLHVIEELRYPGPNSNLQKVTNKYLDWFEKSNQPLPSENLFNNIKSD